MQRHELFLCPRNPFGLKCVLEWRTPGGQAVLYRYGQGPCAPPLQAPIEDCILSAVGTVVVQPGSMDTGRARLAHGGAVSARVGTRGTASGTPLPP